MKKKILLRAPLLTRSGYGEQARFALRSLRAHEDEFDIFIQPLEWGKTSWINDLNEEREWIDQTIEKSIYFIQQGGKFDYSLQVTVPNEFENIADVNIGYTAGIETTKVAPQWLEKSNIMDRLIVVSNHSKEVFEKTVYTAVNQATKEEVPYTLQTPVDVVNYPVKKYDSLPELELNLEYDFNFLCISQMGPRKNLPNLIKWFVKEFKDDEVGLVIKTNIMKNSLVDRLATEDRIKKVIASETKDKKCKVYLLHGDMTDEEIHSLYLHGKIKSFVSFTHGEGFGLPLFEAAYSGLPVVAPGWSGQCDFLFDENKKSHFYNVAFDIQPIQEDAVWDGVVQKDSMWSFAREDSARNQMRKCYEDVSAGNVTACEYATELSERFEENKLYDQFVDSVLRAGESQAKPSKVVVL
jgi:glycosyltransferase involved in cell wall biosynthesis